MLLEHILISVEEISGLLDGSELGSLSCDSALSKANRLILSLRSSLATPTLSVYDDPQHFGQVKCESFNCHEEAVFNWPASGRLCGLHKFPGMIHVHDSIKENVEPTQAPTAKTNKAKNTVCSRLGCSKKARYSFESHPDCRRCQSRSLASAPAYCKEHHEPGMSPLPAETPSGGTKKERKRRATFSSRGKAKCGIEGCSKPPRYNFEALKHGRYCASHRAIGMVFKGRHCQGGDDQVECTGQADYHFANSKVLYCKLHKQRGMVHSRSDRCEVPGCPKQSVYKVVPPRPPAQDGGGGGGGGGGKKGAPAALYCAAHGKGRPGAQNLRHKACQAEGCPSVASFNFQGAQGKRFCARHKLKGMVNRTVRLCARPECTTVPNFDHPGAPRGRYCVSHKEPGMVCIRRGAPLCRHPSGCGRQALFNNQGLARGLYCGEHRLEGMINVKSPKCLEPGCTTEPTFCAAVAAGGDEATARRGGRQRWCSAHKPPGAVSARRRQGGGRRGGGGEVEGGGEEGPVVEGDFSV